MLLLLLVVVVVLVLAVVVLLLTLLTLLLTLLLPRFHNVTQTISVGGKSVELEFLVHKDPCSCSLH